MPEYRRINYRRGAAILGATMVISKLISAIYKLPLLNILGDAGTTHFQVTYQIYAVLLAISTTGIPIALSRLVSAASATGRHRQVRRYFDIALPVFAVVGAVLSLIMFIFADPLAALIGDTEAADGIRILSPAVLFVCLISVFEGYAQGHRDTFPTSLKQITEVMSKLLIGLGAAWWLLRNGYGPPAIAAGAISGVPIGLLGTLLYLVFYQRKREYRHLSDPGTYRDRAEGRMKTLADILRISIPVTLASALMSILTLADMHVVLNRLQFGAGFTEDLADIFYGVYSKGLTLMVMPSAVIVPVSIGVIPTISAALALNRHQRANTISKIALKLTSVLAMPAGVGISVLAYPIFNVLYWNSNEKGPACLVFLGIASYFVCMQLVTTAILQANGLERTPALTFLAGGIAQIAVDYTLVSNPEIGIVGSPVGTVVCYFIITIVNLSIITLKLKNKPDQMNTFLKPALCSLVMAAGAYSVYKLLIKLCANALGVGRLGLGVSLAGGVLFGVAVYAILVIATKTVTRADVEILPKGKKLADLLRMQ